MKICYIAHPISGNLEANLEHLFRVIVQAQTENPEIYPFAPYITDAICLDDAEESSRTLALARCRLVLETFPIDEVWLTGDKISPGMAQEVEWAKARGLKVVDLIGFYKFETDDDEPGPVTE